MMFRFKNINFHTSPMRDFDIEIACDIIRKSSCDKLHKF